MNTFEELLYSSGITSEVEDDYSDILLFVQSSVVKNNIKDLNEYLGAKTYYNREILKRHIRTYIDEISHVSSEELVLRVFDDMTSYGFLNKYFADSDNIEEININAWNGAIIINYSNGEQKYSDETFLSPEHALSVFQRMALQTDRTLDEKSPKLVTFLGKNVRLAVAIAPLVDEETATIASIRFIHPQKFDKHEIIRNGTLTKEMFALLETFINNGVSMGFCGDTGSGKTTLMNAVLKCVDHRLLTLEDGMREFDLVKNDENKKVSNDVVHLQTRPHKNADLCINLEELMDFILRCDPVVVCVGEMVSEEAFIAQETARTGHTVISSLHTNSAVLAYDRMYTLALRKHELPKEVLLEFFIQAFPVMVYTERFSDGVRRVKEIIEATGVKDGRILYNTLFAYHKLDNIKDENGRIVKITGEFKKRANISERLQQMLVDKNMSRAEINKLMEDNIDG